MQLTIRDETATGNITHEMVIEFLTEEITVRELIRSRVYQEVEDYNRKDNADIQWLVQPGQLETQLNQSKSSSSRKKDIDWRPQYEKALEGFLQLRYFILVDNSQPSSLDDRIRLQPDTQVSFVKLVPLVGG